MSGCSRRDPRNDTPPRVLCDSVPFSSPLLEGYHHGSVGEVRTTFSGPETPSSSPCRSGWSLFPSGGVSPLPFDVGRQVLSLRLFCDLFWVVGLVYSLETIGVPSLPSERGWVKGVYIFCPMCDTTLLLVPDSWGCSWGPGPSLTYGF